MKWMLTALFLLASCLCVEAASPTNIVEVTCQPQFQDAESDSDLMDSHGRMFSNRETWLILKDGTKEHRIFWKSRISTPKSVTLATNETYAFTIQTSRHGPELIRITQDGKVLLPKENQKTSNQVPENIGTNAPNSQP